MLTTSATSGYNKEKGFSTEAVMADNDKNSNIVQDTELNNVTGGAHGGEVSYPITCSCGNQFFHGEASDKRTVKDGCTNNNEYQCPKCGRWHKG